MLISKNILTIGWIFCISLVSYSQSFKEKQLRYNRVRTAYAEKGKAIKAELVKRNIKQPEILLRAFKEEETLEVWAKDKFQKKYIKLKSYPFCAFSGVLGPKRKQGDYQIPEGFYHIDRFNPASNFYLSLGINYPNTSDRKLSKYSNLGGDIFIHGDCVTIGCIPITDDLIKELYVLAVEAKNAGQSEIPVHIYPFRLTNESIEQHQGEVGSNTQVLELWKSMLQIEQFFQKNLFLPKFDTRKNGYYTIL